LFLTCDGVVKVLDFGIARLLSQVADASLTKPGAMIGTPWFMAPEQARGDSRGIDAQTDIWGLGATLFTLLSGEAVHEADVWNETILLAASSHARSLAAVRPELDPGVIAFVDKALRREKSERWQTAREMQCELRQVAGHVFVDR